MARRNYVNPSDRGFEAQVAQFLANLGPVKTALGLPANWEAQLQTRNDSRSAWSDPARATVAGKIQRICPASTCKWSLLGKRTSRRQRFPNCRRR